MNTLKSVSIDRGFGFSVLSIELNESPHIYQFPLVGIRKIVPVRIEIDNEGSRNEIYEEHVYQAEC